MTDTAGLIARANEIAGRMRQTFQVTGDVWFERAAAALVALAQENERLKRERPNWETFAEFDAALMRAEAAEARVRELEKDNKAISRRYQESQESLARLVDEGGKRCREAMAERDAIEAKTIERCAKVAETLKTLKIPMPDGEEFATVHGQLIAAAIRATRHSGREAV